jgi:hypothetical protein
LPFEHVLRSAVAGIYSSFTNSPYILLALCALKLDWRLSHEKPSEDCDEAELDPKHTESVKCKIFLGFTSNLVSSGIRDVIRFLVQHHMVNTPSLHHLCVQT